jgi:transcription elongation GreA/GreB family factor
MGKALVGTKVGGVAKFETPRGTRELNVLKITT